MKTRAEIEKAIESNQTATEIATKAKDFKTVATLLMERSQLLKQLLPFQLQEYNDAQVKFKNEIFKF